MTGSGTRPRLAFRGALTTIAFLTAAALYAAADYQPAHLLSGSVPNPPFNAIGWVEAVVDVELDSNGGIMKTTGLRATPGGLESILPSLKSWKFKPANDGEHAVASHVLVAAIMRPAQLFDPAGGSPAVDLTGPIDDAMYPTATSRPKYPAKRVGNRVVLVEAFVAANGHVDKATIVGESSGFDEEALATARNWSFTAPRHDKKAVPGVAYLIFGFRAPVS